MFQPMKAKTKQIARTARDWAGIIAAITALITALSTMVDVDEKATKGDTAVVEAKTDDNYKTLVEAVKHLAVTSSDQAETIGDLREAIGELRGAMMIVHTSGGGSPYYDGPASERVASTAEKSLIPFMPSKAKAKAIQQKATAQEILALPDRAPSPDKASVQKYYKK